MANGLNDITDDGVDNNNEYLDISRLFDKEITSDEYLELINDKQISKKMKLIFDKVNIILLLYQI